MKREKQEGRMLQQESKGGRGRVCRGETKGTDQRDSQRDSQRESQREMPERDAEPEPKNKGKGEGELNANNTTRKPKKQL